jgi:hypothetical protein
MIHLSNLPAEAQIDRYIRGLVHPRIKSELLLRHFNNVDQAIVAAERLDGLLRLNNLLDLPSGTNPIPVVPPAQDPPKRLGGGNPWTSTIWRDLIEGTMIVEEVDEIDSKEVTYLVTKDKEEYSIIYIFTVVNRGIAEMTAQEEIEIRETGGSKANGSQPHYITQRTRTTACTNNI